MAPELTAEDFMVLPRYQIYASIQTNGRSTGWVQGKTLPPPPALREAVELKAMSQATYGIPAEQVEEDYLKLFGDSGETPPEWEDAAIGRRKRP